MRRRDLLGLIAAMTLPRASRAAAYPVVRRGVPLRFPRDHGAHPDYRTEWWYLTGWLRDATGRHLGFQITFFRNRPLLQEDNRSAFAPHQLLFAHAAIADPKFGRLRHDQRVARAGFGLAQAEEATTDVVIDDWSLRLDGDVYRARIASPAFALDLELRATQSVLLEGAGGFSRKGLLPQQASYYYSRPHLAVRGALRLDGPIDVQGEAWLDHEWSSEYMSSDAVGWDWIGINLNDGGALMAFRMRGADGTPRWAGGTWRAADRSVTTYPPAAIAFEPLRIWRSPRTGIDYPVVMSARAGEMQIELQPLMDDQELDARASTGTIYWEGAVRAMQDDVEVGRGYLELTGYWKAMEQL